MVINEDEQEDEFNNNIDSTDLDKTKALERELAEVKEMLSTTKELADSNLNKLKYMAIDLDKYPKQMEEDR